KCLWKTASKAKNSSSLQLEGLPIQRRNFETHVRQHRKCPKRDCPWEGTDEKEKKRHVWTTHRIWAAQNKYSSIGGECPTYGAKFARQDYLVRHQRRKHGG
ncbi:hypothetical protein PoMZ_13663, partial [Pyricularia oryzae]